MEKNENKATETKASSTEEKFYSREQAEKAFKAFKEQVAKEPTKREVIGALSGVALGAGIVVLVDWIL